MGIALSPLSATAMPAPTVVSAVEGATPFIFDVTLANIAPGSVTTIAFEVTPHANTFSAPIEATYTGAYLRNHGLTTSSNTVTIPVFGLYDNYTNLVNFTIIRGNTESYLSTTIQAPAWTTGDAGYFEHPNINKAREQSAPLSYSFYLLKNFETGPSPIIVDTDGYVRWVGSFPFSSQASTFWNNQVWMGQPGTGNLWSEGLDGVVGTNGDNQPVANFGGAPYNVTNIAHHNIDVTSQGMLINVNAGSEVESTIEVVNSHAKITKTFDLQAIFTNYLRSQDVSAAQIAQWINPPNDWFHNNSSTYWPKYNELVVSSRENFVTGINWTTGHIDWILGDPTKMWYVDYPALQMLALTLPANSLYPIGQHAVSIDSNGNLMLFDDGLGSYNHSPSGVTRGYSAASSYSINLVNMTAKMVWNYNHHENLYSAICSSVYEDGTSSYLLDYAAIAGGPRIIGLSNATGTVAFDYQYPGGNYSYGWNAIPIHLENVVYSS